MLCALFLGIFVAGQPPAAAPQPGGVVSAIRVQGNAVTPDAEVVRLSGVQMGAAVDADTIGRAQKALEASRRFARVEVLQRFESLVDPSRVLIVIIVDEGPLKLRGEGPNAQISRSGGPHLLFTPLLSREEGYGWSYGARFAKADPIGAHSRLSFPLTWGGDKRAGADLDKSFDRGPFTSAQASFSVSRRTNPFYDADDDRVRVALRGERQFAKHVAAGVTLSSEHVSFQGAGDRVMDAGVDLTLDTRLDPMLARNAVYARAGWDRLIVKDGPTTSRTSLEGRAYVGFVGHSILVVRALREDSGQALPPYLKPLLGGIETLRGFPVGYKAGDTLVAGSAELRAPLTSPLGIAKFGVRAFVDAGTAYNAGEQFRDQTIDRGAGGGIWLTATVVRLSLDLAHGAGASTRVHFGTSISF